MVRLGEMLYEGKSKKIFATDDPRKVVQFFKDDATAFDGAKKGTIVNKGVINNAVSAHLYAKLEREGIPTHFIDKLSEREQLVRKVTILPIEVVVRNWAAGSLTKRYGVPEGTKLERPLLEFFYKDDSLHDPLCTEDHVLLFNWASAEQTAYLKAAAARVNAFLLSFFDGIGIKLVDYKLEFGTTDDGAILLADEISPDGCRLWDKLTDEKMDKDRFRRDLGKVEEAYEEVSRRILGA